MRGAECGQGAEGAGCRARGPSRRRLRHRERQLRGVESHGMLCSEKELGLSDDHSGIFILPEDAAIGDGLGSMLEISDHVLDVNVPPNRGDCQSILGIAREAAAAYGLTVTLPAFTLVEKEDIDGPIALSVVDKEACPRYVLRIIKDISLVPVPLLDEKQDHQVRHETHKLHCRCDELHHAGTGAAAPRLRLRADRVEEDRGEGSPEQSVFRTLDGVDRKLESGDILICDGTGPVALAGVMGGENSEINPGTRHVALESAFFNPLSIRRTARRLDLRSEASARFERGIDMENVDYCARRAIELMYRTSGGCVLRGSKEIYDRRQQRIIALACAGRKRSSERPSTDDRIVAALESIGVRAGNVEAGKTLFSVPSYRHDLTEYCDLIEEVARIVGYTNIPGHDSRQSPAARPQGQEGRRHRFGKDVSHFVGFFEVDQLRLFRCGGYRQVRHRRIRRAGELRAYYEPYLQRARSDAHLPCGRRPGEPGIQSEQGHQEREGLRDRQGVL